MLPFEPKEHREVFLNVENQQQGRATPLGEAISERTGEGDCYDVALTMLIKMPAQVRDTARLAHGIVTGNGPDTFGIRYGHAWVEMGDTVFDFSNGGHYVGRRDRYYKAANLIEAEVYRYTWDEAATKALRSGHYGPWEGESAGLTATA